MSPKEHNAIPYVGMVVGFLCLCRGDTAHSIPLSARYHLLAIASTEPPAHTAGLLHSSAHFDYCFLYPLLKVLQSKAMCFRDCALLPVQQEEANYLEKYIGTS